MHTARRLVSLLFLLAGELVAVGLLTRLGGREPFVIPLDDLDAWARTTDPVDAVAALIRLVALVAAGWLLLTTLLYVAARVTDTPRALRAIEWATLPTVRRVVDHALVLVAVGALVSPAGAAPLASSPPVVTVRDGRSGTTPTTRAPATPAIGAPVVAVPVAVTPSSVTRDSTVVVAAGDNLWNLAAARLAVSTGRARATLDNGEIARYWVVVCDANRTRVRSGDVNLIYPGELIVLPALE